MRSAPGDRERRRRRPERPRLLAELLAAATDETLRPELRRLGDEWNDGIHTMLRAAIDTLVVRSPPPLA